MYRGNWVFLLGSLLSLFFIRFFVIVVWLDLVRFLFNDVLGNWIYSSFF